VNGCIVSGDDVATSCKNYVNFGPVTPEITKGVCGIFATTGQKTAQKSAYPNRYLSLLDQPSPYF